jgi:hypothetical protein
MLMVPVLLLVAACVTTPEGPQSVWGEPYDDVAVPEGYLPYDNPAFKREDGADGRRIFGRYSYRSPGETLDSAERVLNFLKEAMPEHGWEFMVESLDTQRGTMSVRFQKGPDQVLMRLAPDRRVRGTGRYSVLTVEMNPQYE